MKQFLDMATKELEDAMIEKLGEGNERFDQADLSEEDAAIENYWKGFKVICRP